MFGNQKVVSNISSDQSIMKVFDKKKTATEERPRPTMTADKIEILGRLKKRKPELDPAVPPKKLKKIEPRIDDESKEFMLTQIKI